MAFGRLRRGRTRGLHWLLGLDRRTKRALQVLADILLLAASFALAMLLRLESWAEALNGGSWIIFALGLPLTILVFVRLGFYRAIIRFIGEKALMTVVVGVLVSAAILLVLRQATGLFLPRSVPLIYALLAFASIGSIRLMMRDLFLAADPGTHRRVVIYGAGEAGRQLVPSLRQNPDYEPVAFLDDDRELQGTTIAGLSVHPPPEAERLVLDTGADMILLALPTASRAERSRILARLEPLGIRVQTLPSLAELVDGRARLAELEDIPVEDLLGRDPIPPHADMIEADIRGKSVLVTGAGGSIGSELCRQILRAGPRRLVLLDISEYALYAIHQELGTLAGAEGLDVETVPLLGSVRDAARIAGLFAHHGIDTVYHAAAYKHVPLVEQNAVEGLRNNVFGTRTLLDAALGAGVRSFILVSTDKAVRPTNVMGASKRLAELVCQSAAGRAPGTRIAIVRFGNVLGSSGSVIPLFRRQIRNGGPVTVTHPEVTRYFMTIPEAAQLVIQAGAMAEDASVFLLDMGEPVRIVDLAMRMVRLAGLRPVLASAPEAAAPPARGEVRIEFTALRPGEKLYEELLISAENTPTAHPKIMKAAEPAMRWRDLADSLDALEAACSREDSAGITAILAGLPLGYAPDGLPRRAAPASLGASAASG